MKHFLLVLAFLFSYGLSAQSYLPTYLGMQGPEKKGLPEGWNFWGDYATETLPAGGPEGKPCICITPADETSRFGSPNLPIRANWPGKRVRLVGWLKTENVTDGFAGLLLRVDGAPLPDRQMNTLAFDNMSDENLDGSRDWQRYEIEVDYDAVRANSVIVAGILTGKGRACFADFHLFIDGEEITQTLAQKPAELLAAAAADTIVASGFTPKKATAEYVERLRQIGHIWGFLKYYHPTVRAGEIDWDMALFTALRLADRPDFDTALADWIRALPEPKEVAPVTQAALPESRSVKMEAPLEWLDKLSLSETQKVLRAIHDLPRNDRNHYVSLQPSVGNPDFSQENPYTKAPVNDAGYRLLGLFRYWNIIQYYFPYRYLIDRDWSEVLRENIPAFLAAEDQQSYRLALLRLISEVHDTHANLRDRALLANHFGHRVPPVQVRFVEGELTVIRIAEEGPEVVKIGDRIVTIDGVATERWVRDRLPYFPGSNERVRRYQMARRGLLTAQESIRLGLQEGGKVKEIELPTAGEGQYRFARKDRPAHRDYPGKIAYLFPAKLEPSVLDSALQAYADYDGMIVDLRAYPRHFMVFTLGNFLHSTPTPFVRFSAGNLAEPGQFTVGGNLSVGREDGGPFRGKLVVLVNENTLSQAEYTAMALRAVPGAIVMGGTTAAADGNVSRIALPGGVTTYITGIGVYYPDGSETQRVGIVPDRIVEPTRAGIIEGRDEVLEAALAYLRN